MDKTKYIIGLLNSFYEYKTGKLRCNSLPTNIFIEPTNVCNLKCIMCPNKDLPESKTGFMEFALFKNIIDEASTFAKCVNLFLTGEPFAHPGILDMISYTKSKGLKVKINSNGTLLNKTISEKLISCQTDILTFSFDGYDAETYNSIRKNADFEKTLGKIKDFLIIKKKLHSKVPFTIIQTLCFNDNKPDTAKRKSFKKHFKGLPVDRFSSVLAIRWPGQEVMDGNGFQRAGQNYQPCIDPWFTMNILWNGDIVPCCGDYSGAYIIGNASEISLKEAWNSNKITALRDNLIKNRLHETPADLCGNCDRLYEKKFFGFPARNLKYFIKERLHYE